MKGENAERNQDEFARERGAALFDHLGSISRATIVVSTILALALYQQIELFTLGGWWLGNVTLAFGRIELRRRYEIAARQEEWASLSALKWIHYYTWGALLSGVMWGSTALLLWVPESPSHQALLALVLAGLSAGAASTQSVYRPAFYAWLAPALLPMTFRCLLEGGVFQVIGALLCAFTLMMLLVVRRSYGVHRASFVLHAEKEQLIRRLQREERLLREGNQALEVRVEERTEQLRTAQQEKERAEFELRHAQKLEALGQLTGGVAHDFNNLLTVIVGSLDGIEADSSLSAGSARFAKSARRAAQRGARLTHSLLAFSRKQLLQPVSIELPAMLQELSDSLLHSTLGARTKLELTLSPHMWNVLADPDRLQTALLNLCVNARDAMQSTGTIALRAVNLEIQEATQHLPVGHYVRLDVEDHGCGIPPEQVERVFEPFFTTKQRGEGSGLGLSIVYGFCQQSGGHAYLTSKVGVGTTVSLILPRSSPELDSKDQTGETLEQLPGGQGQVVLLVEDDPTVRDLAKKMLTLLDYKVCVAADAEAALKLLRNPKLRVSFLFSDVVMPGKLDGIGLAKQAEQLRPELAIVLTSGFRGRSARASSSAQWVQLPKPYGVKALALALAETAQCTMPGSYTSAGRAWFEEPPKE